MCILSILRCVYFFSCCCSKGIAPGYWVGVRYDEPVGKSDGRIKGKRFFDAPSNRGGFIRGKNIIVGNYPERGLDDVESEDEI